MLLYTKDTIECDAIFKAVNWKFAPLHLPYLFATQKTILANFQTLLASASTVSWWSCKWNKNQNRVLARMKMCCHADRIQSLYTILQLSFLIQIDRTIDVKVHAQSMVKVLSALSLSFSHSMAVTLLICLSLLLSLFCLSFYFLSNR